MALIELENPTPHLPASPVFPSAAVAITPSDTDTFSHAVTVYVGGAGTVVITPWNGTVDVTFAGLAAGSQVPCLARKVHATGTTATNLVAIY